MEPARSQEMKIPKGHVAEMARFSREEKRGKCNDTQGIETFRIGDGVCQPE